MVAPTLRDLPPLGGLGSVLARAGLHLTLLGVDLAELAACESERKSLVRGAGKSLVRRTGNERSKGELAAWKLSHGQVLNYNEVTSFCMCVWFFYKIFLQEPVIKYL